MFLLVLTIKPKNVFKLKHFVSKYQHLNIVIFFITILNFNILAISIFSNYNIFLTISIF